jgi:hypothetical protein
MVPPPNFNYGYQGNLAPSASQGKQKTPALSKNSALPESKKRKVAEVALGSQPKAGSATAVSQCTKVGKQNPQTQAVQLQAPKRVKSFARLSRKAQLYQAAMYRFRRCLVYHKRRFSKNIQEGNLIDLIDMSEEVEMVVALMQKQRNRDRLDQCKAKSLANKGFTLAKESQATLDQAAARDSQSSNVVSSTPVSLDMDVEMTTVVALPVGELREGQIYHLVDGRLVVYDQAHLSTDPAFSSPPLEVLLTSTEQPTTYAEIAVKELPARPASTGLEEELAKLSTSCSEASQGQVATGCLG